MVSLPPSFVAKTKAVEPWYITLSLIAFTTTGILPILLPLAVMQSEGKALHVGWVLSSIGAGMLTAPIWGGAADRWRCHRLLMVFAGLAVAAALLGFTTSPSIGGCIALAFLAGCGVSAGFTVANLLIACCYPVHEADKRVGTMQSVVSFGTVLGLAVAGGVSNLPVVDGFEAGAATCALAAGLAYLTTPVPPRGTTMRSIQMMQGSLRQATKPRLPFFLLLTLWFGSNIGIFALNALYPLMMLSEFKIPPEYSSFALAGGAAVSTALFLLASTFSGRFGERGVLAGGLSWRAACLVGFIFLTLAQPFWGRGVCALAIFFLMSLSWPFLSVSSTVLVSLLARNKGDGLGIYSSAEAMGHLIGPILGGKLADLYGYAAIMELALAGAVMGVVITGILKRLDKSATFSRYPLRHGVS